MSEKSLFFDSVGGDRKYNSSDFTTYFSKVLTDGIFPNPSTNLQVVANGNMTVTVKPGGANIKGYLYNLDENKIITIEPATTTRKDSIVVRWDIGQRKISVEYKQGIIEPTRTVSIYELVLAEITVNASVSSISQSNIYDTRQITTKCGLVNSLIQTDTTELFAGFEEGFSTWFNNIKGLLSTDQAGNLQLQINNINTELLEKASKDGTLQIGLNSEKVGGKSVDELTSKIDFDNFVNSKGKANGIVPLNSNNKIDDVYLNKPVSFVRLPSIGTMGGSYTNVTIENYIEIIFKSGTSGGSIKFNNTTLINNSSTSYLYVGRIIITKEGKAYIGSTGAYSTNSMDGYDMAGFVYNVLSQGGITPTTVTINSLNTITVVGLGSMSVEVIKWL